MPPENGDEGTITIHGAAADDTAEHLAFTVGTTFWEEDEA